MLDLNLSVQSVRANMHGLGPFSIIRIRSRLHWVFSFKISLLAMHSMLPWCSPRVILWWCTSRECLGYLAKLRSVSSVGPSARRTNEHLYLNKRNTLCFLNKTRRRMSLLSSRDYFAGLDRSNRSFFSLGESSTNAMATKAHVHSLRWKTKRGVQQGLAKLDSDCAVTIDPD